MRGALLALVLGLVGGADAAPGAGGGPRPPEGIKALPGKPGLRAERTGAGGRKVNVGESHLRQGNYLLAVRAFREDLELDPESVPAHVGLGKAYGRMGKCADALNEFWPHVGLPAFGAEAASIAATCANRLGDIEEALFFAEMAYEIRPEDPKYVTSYLLLLDEAGRLDEVDDLLGWLAALRDERDASLYAQAVLAIRRGDLDTFDYLAFVWPEDRRVRTDLARLEAQTWLDLDDPWEVVDSVRKIKRLRRGQYATWLRAEATRRMGLADEAASYLDSRSLKRSQSLSVDAVRARVLADQGDLAGAEEVLGGYGDALDPDLVASRWYLAWRRGDQAAMAREAVSYEHVRLSPLRDLEQLVPFSERTGGR